MYIQCVEYDVIITSLLFKGGSPGSFEVFLEASPHLSDPQLLSHYYSLSRVHSSEARNRYGINLRDNLLHNTCSILYSWLEPDLRPLP